MASAVDAMKFMSEQSGFSEDVSGAMGMASSSYTGAKNAYEALKGNKQALGQTLELSAGGVFAGVKYLNKTTGLPDQASEGVDNISAYLDKLKAAKAVADDPASTITSQVTNPAFEKAPLPSEDPVVSSGSSLPEDATAEDFPGLSDAPPSSSVPRTGGDAEPQDVGPANPESGTSLQEGDDIFAPEPTPPDEVTPPTGTQEQMDLTDDVEPDEGIESGGVRSAAADSVDVTSDASVAAGATTAEATGADAAAETGLEIAGAALDATGIGAIAGVALQAAAVLGPAIAGLVELFGGHTKAPSPTPPDLSGIAVPTFQAGVN